VNNVGLLCRSFDISTTFQQTTSHGLAHEIVDSAQEAGSQEVELIERGPCQLIDLNASLSRGALTFRPEYTTKGMPRVPTRG
jgi:hypothetical protein